MRSTALLASLALASCAPLPQVATAARETRQVVVVGDRADTLAETLGPEESGLVLVRTHDGRERWVREGAIATPQLSPGTWVLLSSAGSIVRGEITGTLDDFVEVRVDGVLGIAPLPHVLAILHAAPASDAVETPTTTPDVAAAPPTPITQMVTLEVSPVARVGLLQSCTAGATQITYADGTTAQAARADVHALRIQAGAHVEALWGGTPYPAIVLATNGTLVQLRWEDATEQWVERTEVTRLLDGATGPAVRGCPSGTPVVVTDGERVRVGRVLTCDETTATVLDLSASEGTIPTRVVPLASLARLPLRAGDRVEARWNGGAAYAATVLTLGERVHLRWDDASETDVDPAEIVAYARHTERPAEPPTCP